MPGSGGPAVPHGDGDGDTASTPPSVSRRVFAILESFDAGHRRQSLTSIVRRTALPRSTVHRLVHELRELSVLTRGVDGDYEVGSLLWRLGVLASVHADLREVALPYMEDVYEVSGGAVQIAVLDGMRCLVVDRIAGSRSLAVLSRPGSRLPLHASGVGKVLLAFGGDELQGAVLDSLDRYTVSTVTDAEALRRQLRTIVARGYAVTSEELAPGASSIAVPVRGKSRSVIAALGVVTSHGVTATERLAPVLQVTAAALSRKLIEAGMGTAERVRIG